MELTEGQQRVVDSEGHVLVTGGPGSGKTTVAILKASKLVADDLLPGQKILFLGFARATVSRVIEAIEHEQRIPSEQKRRIDVETYHSFFWRVLRSHGYLVGLPRRMTILAPPAEAIALSVIRAEYPARPSAAEKAEKREREIVEQIRLAQEEGRVCFDRFAPSVGDILDGSERIRRLIASMYPVIILDEFQDTNAAQWRVVEALGQFSTLIALADPEQRIYDFIGADPQRLNHFREAFNPTEVDLSEDNHRSSGTDIALFGNDLLRGVFRQDEYVGVNVREYEANYGQAMTALVTATFDARKRLVDAEKKDWSLAVLVPTKKMTRVVSDAFRSPPAGMRSISHRAVIELEAAILGAELIAFLLQPDVNGRHFAQFIEVLRNYYHGRGGDQPTRSDLEEAERIRRAHEEWVAREAAGRELRRNSLLVSMLETYRQARAVVLSGDPERDWRAVRDALEGGPCSRLKNVADEVRNIRLLERGAQLRTELAQDWRETGAYSNALAIIRSAFVQEHFSKSAKPEAGVVVMNMHKAKGKQFDEVIIFDGWPRTFRGQIVANLDRIVRSNDRAEVDDQARQNFRVSVTRGKKRVTILTPRIDPCVLLVPDE